MPRWFLSYHSPDENLAKRLKTAIEGKDAGSSVFFAPSSLRAGGAWTGQLAEELAKADGFVLLIGDALRVHLQLRESDAQRAAPRPTPRLLPARRFSREISMVLSAECDGFARWPR